MDAARTATIVADAAAGRLAAGAPGGRHEPYLRDAVAFAESRADAPNAVRELRAAAASRFASIGLPSPRDEDWRFTNVAPVAETPFRRADGPGAVTPEDLRPHLYGEAYNMVFVDGHPAPHLGTGEPLPSGVVATSLSEALASRPDEVLPHLGRHVRFDRQPFVALNTAFLADGAFVRVPERLPLERPIHLVFVSTGGRDARASYPRNLIVVGDRSAATIVETYVGLGSGAYLTCAVTELSVGAEATVDHYKVQQESLEGLHLATLQLVQGRHSDFATHSISTGGALVRYDVNAFLDGEGLECTLNGLYVAGGGQHVDHHMWVEHAQPHGNSRELFKGILDGDARAVFNGRIYVHRAAQGTDAKQSNRNLLLSDRALCNSNPQLEIFADDVKCTHGSTVGQIDEDAIFYLRSRGIGEAAARSLLVYAFAGDIVGGIRLDEVRTRLEEHLYQRLPHGEVVRQAV